MFLRKPKAAGFKAFTIISLLFVIGKLVQQVAWKFRTLPAVVMSSLLTTVFYRAGFAPKGLVDFSATLAVHLLTIFALAA